MRLKRLVAVLALTTGVLAVCSAQSWSDAYDKALSAAKDGKWSEARAAFLEAKAIRPEDQSGPTNLPGPVSEPRRWRGGAPYSPNFGGAYAGFRQADATKDQGERSTLLKAVISEFETLLNKGQQSPETYYFLGQAYNRARDIEGSRNLEARAAKAAKMAWRVDTQFVAPEEIAAIAAATGKVATATTPGAPVKVNNVTTVSPNTANGNPLTGRVAAQANKFALVIGNSESAIPDGKLEFAAADAMLVREALVETAGYPEENVDVVTNATAEQIQKSAAALAARVGANATVTIFFSGAGVNIDGKDYLAGIDTESPSDKASMVPKADLYKLFMGRGAQVFAFFEANRPIVNGRYFGMEVPLVGAIAQMQSTSPGDSCLGFVRDGKLVGVFAKAMASVLNAFHTNRVPITDFGWQVFYDIRKGDTGTNGVGSKQTPTLPYLTNMASDARF